tara:strand:+ start:164 stop:1111 length:948 start_codon:yes stop_codon:yes gene_type:complete
MAKKKKKVTEQMDNLDLVGIAVSPIVRKKKKAGGAMTDKNTWEKTSIEKKKRQGMKKGGKGIEALRKEAPEVVERMGYQAGDEVKNDRIAFLTKELLRLDREKETALNNGNTEKVVFLTNQINEAEEQLTKLQPDLDSNRDSKQEGGEMDSQMTAMMMPEEETEEMDMLPDEQMEDEHLDFIINEALDQEEEMYLMEKLQADDRLSMIFDKIMDTASEFSGSGPVEGLGTGVSDSIPARLSDGEFVMTAKATEEIGADNLQRMMKDAEEASDNRQRVAMGGELEKKVDEFGKPIDQDLADEEIKRSMLSVNPRLQ